MAATVDLLARAAVLAQIALAHDHFIALERRAWKDGKKAEAEGAHRISLSLLRAYKAEDRDEKPKDLP